MLNVRMTEAERRGPYMPPSYVRSEKDERIGEAAGPIIGCFGLWFIVFIAVWLSFGCASAPPPCAEGPPVVTKLASYEMVQDDPDVTKLPVAMICIQAGQRTIKEETSMHEVRACKAFERVLRNEDGIRAAVPGESALVFYVTVEEEDDRVSAMYEAIWMHPGLGGVGLIVWSRLEVWEFKDLADSAKQEEIFLSALRTFENWIDPASAVFDNFCPPCEPRGQSVWYEQPKTY